MKKNSILLLTILLFLNVSYSNAQLKFILEDFEGLAEGQSNLKKEGLFTYGSARAQIDNMLTTGYGYSGARSLKIEWKKGELYGGWGKGIGLNMELNAQQDFLNFYMYSPKSNKRSDKLKITLEEDDNNNAIFEKDQDDSWSYIMKKECKDEWQLVSIPLSDFKDSNKGGDGKFNISYKEGKLLTFIISFLDTNYINDHQAWYFDFICFSKGKLPMGADKFEPPVSSKNDTCILGAWSEEGNDGNFLAIPKTFESLFNTGSISKKIELVHFFKPFAAGGPKAPNLYFNAPKINELFDKGYTPMITIEDHYVKVEKKQRQPNLYSIVEGHFDYLFIEWAKRMKEVKGPVLLRILHEFNGDWYPWSIAKNDNNAKLFIQAYQHIWTIFNSQNVTNVKFIWCPNSMSSPQQAWNFIMDAYPGDKYVDYVGLDVYNGAGDNGIPIWRSFRKEAIENYFLLTENFPTKPLIICETSSRERKTGEQGVLQNKAEWIGQMSEALKTDLSKITAVTWFNQYDQFKVNSSPEAQKSYLDNFWLDPFYHKKEMKSTIGTK